MKEKTAIVKTSTRDEYVKRINRVMEYINNHLDESMNLEKLSEISHFSPFHFHRIFKAFQQETLAAYITRIRVETAARLLRYSETPIEAIAYHVGYEVPSSLSKAFKQFYNLSPAAYRADKNHTIIMKSTTVNIPLNLKAPKIRELETKNAIYIRLTGKYADLDFAGTWGRLWNFVKEQRLFSAGIEHIGIYHDDPNITESEKLRSDVCLVIHKPAQPKGEIGVKEIAGGQYAVFLYQGPYSNLGLVYDTIFSQWLPESGCELRNVPMFEKYGNNPDSTEPEKLKTEIYIPIQ